MLYSSFEKYYVGDFNALEEEFLGTDKYVSIDKKNYKTFSSKYMQLFLSICSGIDSLAEEFCSALDDRNGKKTKRFSMLHRFNQIKNEFANNIVNEEIKMFFNAEKICIKPYAKFNENSCGDWWQDYNYVKHRRTGEVELTNGNMYNYELANLKNVVYGLAAYFMLISLVSTFLKPESAPIKSQIFSYYS